MTRLPNALILGAGKAGTTSLYHLLAQHPDVCASKPKEPRFFEFEFYKGMDHYWDAYFGHHAGEPVAVEASPFNLLLPYVRDRIADSLPEAKLIVIVRDPVERAISDWWMYYSRGLETRSLEDALRWNLEVAEEGHPIFGEEGQQVWRENYESIHLHRRLQIPTYLEAGYYTDQLRGYLRHYDKDAIHLVLLRDLKRDPVAVAQDLYAFVGVSPSFEPPETEAKNEAFGRMPWPVLTAIRMANHLRLPVIAPDWFKAGLRRLFTALGDRPEVDQETRICLSELYRGKNEQLEKMWDLDISHWGFRMDDHARFEGEDLP